MANTVSSFQYREVIDNNKNKSRIASCYLHRTHASYFWPEGNRLSAGGKIVIDF